VLIFSAKARFLNIVQLSTSKMLTKVIRVIKHSFLKDQTSVNLRYRFEFVFCGLE